MKREYKGMIFGVILLGLWCAGCGEEQQSAPPKSGDALRTHLLDIIKSRTEAFGRGDLAGGRSYDLPVMVAEQKAEWQLRGLTWPETLSKEQIERMSKNRLPGLFSGDAPIEMELSGDWAYLRQAEDDKTAHHAYFLLRDGKWWVVSAYSGDATSAADDKYAYLRTDTYWPDHIEDYFFLPPIKLEVKPSDKPSTNDYFDWRLSLHVTNKSDKTISAKAMSRRFTSVTFVTGKWQSAVDPFGGEEFRALKPGEHFYVGDVQIQSPKDKKLETVFYVGSNVSNRILAR